MVIDYFAFNSHSFTHSLAQAAMHCNAMEWDVWNWDRRLDFITDDDLYLHLHTLTYTPLTDLKWAEITIVHCITYIQLYNVYTVTKQTKGSVSVPASAKTDGDNRFNLWVCTEPTKERRLSHNSLSWSWNVHFCVNGTKRSPGDILSGTFVCEKRKLKFGLLCF